MARTIDEDGVPLVDEKYASKPSATSLCTTPRVALLVALLVAMMYFSSLGGTDKTRGSNHLEIHQSVHEKSGADGNRQDDARPSTDITIAGLLAKLKTARKELDERLKEGYGQYYEPMFYVTDGVSRGRNAFISGNDNGKDVHVSQDRFKRKLKIKVLEKMVHGKTNFVWVTGGHSATAGHGNLYDESYTAYLERAVKPAFDALGLGFEARNYAMGGRYMTC
jgi:hypothetical protein